jgi:hypothetical protein
MSEPDVFEQFMAREGQSKGPSDKPIENNTNKKLLPLQLNEERFKRRELFAPGTRLLYLEVLERVLSNENNSSSGTGMYLCRCHAPRPGGGECGRTVPISYHRLYYSRPESCGCVPKQRHPTVCYENLLIERIEVLRWDYKDKLWECLCHECARLMYRKSITDIRALAHTCEGHEVAYLPVSRGTSRHARRTRSASA